MRRRNVALLCVGILAVALVVLTRVWIEAGKASVRKNVAAIQAQGYPISPEELDAWYVAPPESENGGPLYEDAFGRLSHIPPAPDAVAFIPLIGEAKLPPGDQPLPPELRARIASLLEERRDILDLLHEAGLRKRARYSVDLSQSLGKEYTRRPHGEAAKWLVLDAILCAERGDSGAAAVRLADTVRLAESLAEEPLLFSQIVRMLIHNLAVDGIEQVLSRQPLDPEPLERLSQVLADAEQRDTFYRGMAGERAMLLPAILSPDMESRVGPSTDVAERIRTPLARLLRSADINWYLNRVATIIEASRGTEEECRTLAAAGHQEPPPYYVLSSLLMPVVEDRLNDNLRDLARLRAARMALAVEQYRIEHKALPEELAALVPKYVASIPNDPCTDAPLLYRRLDVGYVVYSVGPDAADRSSDPSRDDAGCAVRVAR